jgi:VWFA-related protein
MIHSILASGLAALALLLVDVDRQSASPRRASDAQTRDIYVSVLDGRGVPVTGLTAADFVVREDGLSREVLKAAPATAPMQIMVVIDDSQAATQATQPLREGLTAFVTKLKGRAEIGLVTVGERATSLVPYTTDTAALEKGINRIFPRAGAGAYLLDGIMDVSRGLERRRAVRPVIVAITFEGVEYSNLHYQEVLKALDASGAALHVLAVGSPSPSMADEIRNRNMVIAEGTERTGGRRDQVLTHSFLAEVLPRVAAELLDQYVVTYSRSDALIPPEKIQVSVTRPGITVRARTRVVDR